MKVLEPGKTSKKWSLQHRCTGWNSGVEGCGALLELETNDLRYHPGYSDEKSDFSATVSFKCVCCNTVTNLGLNDWPKDYRHLKKWTVDWFLNRTAS